MTFKEYYKQYLSLHKNPICKLLHVLGQVVTVSYIIAVTKFSLQDPRVAFLYLFAPFVVYPFAWSGHFFFEKNKPAAFKNPLWAKVCDWIMLKDIIIGRVKIKEDEKTSV